MSTATPVQPFIRAAYLSSPQNNLSAAIGIIQSQILASDSMLERAAMFGYNDHTDTLPLEAALSLLLAVLDPVEKLQWKDDARPHVAG